MSAAARSEKPVPVSDSPATRFEARRPPEFPRVTLHTTERCQETSNPGFWTASADAEQETAPFVFLFVAAQFWRETESHASGIFWTSSGGPGRVRELVHLAPERLGFAGCPFH